jgi:hypothetical protein
MLGKTIEFAIEIENNRHTNRFDPDPDSDFDPKNTFEKYQSFKLITLIKYDELDILNAV